MRNKRVGLGCAAAIVGLVVILWISGAGPSFVTLVRRGVVEDLINRPAKRTYTPDRSANLKALHTALMQYHDSEGQFPLAEGWMDAIEPRMPAFDLGPAEVRKKFTRPDLVGQGDAYGYALNARASGKYKDDLGEARTVLVYESRQRGRNASGDPDVDGDGLAVTVNGGVLTPGSGAKP